MNSVSFDVFFRYLKIGIDFALKYGSRGHKNARGKGKKKTSPTGTFMF